MNKSVITVYSARPLRGFCWFGRPIVPRTINSSCKGRAFVVRVIRHRRILLCNSEWSCSGRSTLSDQRLIAPQFPLMSTRLIVPFIEHPVGILLFGVHTLVCLPLISLPSWALRWSPPLKLTSVANTSERCGKSSSTASNPAPLGKLNDWPHYFMSLNHILWVIQDKVKKFSLTYAPSSVPSPLRSDLKTVQECSSPAFQHMNNV